MTNKIDCTQRAAQAKAIFESGYNCAQAVAMAYADVMGCEKDMVATIATSFGGGFARQREICGAVSGMGMVSSFVIPSIDPKDKQSKMANYAFVGGAVDKFREANGSIVCRELLGLTPSPNVNTKKRSCAEMVEMAARIIGEEINSK